MNPPNINNKDIILIVHVVSGSVDKSLVEM